MNAEEVKGRIFDIQKFSVHDGPGIRTNVFLKGCILKCRWCCNPESQRFETETMLKNGERVTVGRDVTVREVIDDVKKDMPYYRRSGGGMTLTGGEAFCQPDFAAALFRCAKSEGINTAVETTAAVKWENIEKSLGFVDHFLIDVKHTDSAKHREYTGVGTETIRENIIRLSRLLSHGGTLTVRVPTIPGFNDTEREIRDIAKFAVSVGANELHLLPYHKLGYDKYVGLNREYAMGDAATPDKEKMAHLQNTAENEGIHTLIGG